MANLLRLSPALQGQALAHFAYPLFPEYALPAEFEEHTGLDDTKQNGVRPDSVPPLFAGNASDERLDGSFRRYRHAIAFGPSQVPCGTQVNIGTATPSAEAMQGGLHHVEEAVEVLASNGVPLLARHLCQQHLRRQGARAHHHCVQPAMFRSSRSDC